MPSLVKRAFFDRLLHDEVYRYAKYKTIAVENQILGREFYGHPHHFKYS